MPYVRISLMKPLAGREAEVADLNAQLVSFYRRQRGCLQSGAPAPGVSSIGDGGNIDKPLTTHRPDANF